MPNYKETSDVFLKQFRSSHQLQLRWRRPENFFQSVVSEVGQILTTVDAWTIWLIARTGFGRNITARAPTHIANCINDEITEPRMTARDEQLRNFDETGEHHKKYRERCILQFVRYAERKSSDGINQEMFDFMWHASFGAKARVELPTE